jgi:hypothetical protein
MLGLQPDHLAGAQAAAQPRLRNVRTLRLLATASTRRVSSGPPRAMIAAVTEEEADD